MKKELTRNQLKYIAVAAMLIDHIGMFFVPVSATPWGVPLRVIGRLTAPIMCFFLAEGFLHTSSRKKYAGRLFLCAVISQFAYAYAHGLAWNAMDFNMITTLFLSLIMLECYEKIENGVLRWLAVAGLIVLTGVCDWGFFAPLWVLGFYMDRDDRKKQIVSFSAIAALLVLSDVIFSLANGNAGYVELWQLGVFLFLPLLACYHGKKGSGGAFSKWVFYVFYPAHLAVLGLICHLTAA